MSHFVRAFIVLLSIVFLLSAKSLANLGDTIWVQAQNDVQLINKFVVTIQQMNRNSDGYAVNNSTEHKHPVHAAFYYYRLKLYYTDGSWKYSNNIRLLPVAISEYADRYTPGGTKACQENN